MKTRMTLLCGAAWLALGAFSSVRAQSPAFDTLYDFTATSGSDSNNLDGAFPESPLLLAGSTLYGTAINGGTAGNGTIFGRNTNGSGFTNLYNFSAGGTNILGYLTNSDGASPFGGPLILSGSTLYGTAQDGGSANLGTVFSLHTDGSDFTNLYNFSLGENNASNVFTNSGGALPVAALLLSGYTLYGTAAIGGTNGDGTLFALSLPAPPSLAITPSGKQVVISWPASASTFVLQTATNLASGSWSDITNGIAAAGTNNVFTNTAGGRTAFFRLQQQ
jgi:uncharacterized repeat protein (TIGR03803 family)